ncbi:MAG: cistern family PEP-CTERM protein [Elainellaceae cyanobacterium]
MRLGYLMGSLLLGLGAVPMLSVVKAQPASAFSWDENRATIHNGDQAGTSFEVFFFDGYINENLTEGLTSEAKFTLAQAYDGGSQAIFDVLLKNTSSAAKFDSVRVSGLGFNVDPDLDNASVSQENNPLKNVKLNGKVPQPKISGGSVDVCFTGKNSCTGGGGAGVGLGESASFQSIFNFSGDANKVSFSFTDFVVRYQSIDFKGSPQGESGVGTGTVPTPALLPGLIGMGVAALRKRKEQNAEASSQA